MHFVNKPRWRRQRHPTPVLLPGKSHGRRSLVGCSPWGREESDTTKWLHFHFSLSCLGKGNGNPLHYSCLENPRDGGARWAAVHGVAKSRTRLSDFTFTFHFQEMATHSSILAGVLLTKRSKVGWLSIWALDLWFWILAVSCNIFVAWLNYLSVTK